MRILVTGVMGFAGSHLADALLAQGNPRIIGLARRGTWPDSCRHLAGQVELHQCDLCDRDHVEQILRTAQPEHIYHLAGYPHVGRSFREPDAAWLGNLTATRSLYEAVIRWGGRPRILFVGSGLVYGDSEEGEDGCTENAQLLPDTPYAASKAAADLVSYQYTRYPGLEIVRARPFNHIGPRQDPQFALSNFARQLVAIERGRQAPILETGNVQTRRDLTDVRDVVNAYILVMQRGRSGDVYNVGSGRSYAMRDVLQRLVALSGIAVEPRQTDHLLRAADAPDIRANAAKLRRDIGWEPRFSLDQSLTDLLAYWREQS
jgi:GDP-4-dehydro-6-deoxy-D-mannose reductase